MKQPECPVDDCQRPARSKIGGLCEAHRLRLARRGTLELKRDLAAHAAMVNEYLTRCLADTGGDECWPVPFPLNKTRYGQLRRNGQRLAHRAVWVEVNGPIPDGLHVLHRCDNPPCARPSHLFLGTHADNMRDMSEKGRRVGNGRVPKITDDDVREIRRQAAQGRPRREIAAEFGISHSYCIEIGRGSRRSDVAS